MCGIAIETGDHGNRLAAAGNQLVFGHGNAGLLCEGEGEDFACGDVAGVVGAGKFGDGEASIGEGDGGLWPCAPKGRPLTKQVAEILGGFGVAVDGIGCMEKCRQLNHWGNFCLAGGEDRSVGVLAEAEGADAGGVVEGEDLFTVLIGFASEDFFANCPFDERPAPAVGTAVLDGTEELGAVMGACTKGECGGINGKSVRAFHPLGRVFKGNGGTASCGV